MLISPWHISGSSFLRLTHTYSCLSCTYGQFQGPKDRQDLGPLTGNKLKATPKMSKINKVSNDTKINLFNSLTICMGLAQNLSRELDATANLISTTTVTTKVYMDQKKTFNFMTQDYRKRLVQVLGS